MSRFIGVLVAALTIVGVSVVGSAGAQATAAAQTVLYDCGGAKQIRPTAITVYCGDAGITVGSITWATWGRESASGSGIQYTKVCVPNCAEGGVTTRPVDVGLYKVSRGEFTRISLSGAGGTQSYVLTGASPSRR